MSRYRYTFQTFLLFFFATQVHGQNPAIVRQIQITSSWSGIRGMPTAHVVIQRDGDVYNRDGEPVDGAKVEALAKALRGPYNLEPSLDDLGVTPAWLKANARSVAQKESESLINGVKPDLAALASSFADPGTMDKIALALFSSHHTDDFADVKVAVSFTDGSFLVATTMGSQAPLLLPWRGEDGGKPWVAYNADISRAVAALMPEKAVNRSRLAGTNLDTMLAQPLIMQISARKHLDEVEKQTGTTLSVIRARYTVLNAHVGSYREPVASRGEAEETGLSLDLKSSGLPSYFIENVMLRCKDGSVVGTDAFLREAPQYEKLAVSIPWLNEYLQQNPSTTLHLYFVHGVSFTDAAFRLFSADMRAIGREASIPEVASLKDRIALVTVGYGIPSSDWLVFPDGHMLLWRYRSIPTMTKTLLKWPISEVSTQPCSEGSSLIGCAGRVVDRSGNLN